MHESVTSHKQWVTHPQLLCTDYHNDVRESRGPERTQRPWEASVKLKGSIYNSWPYLQRGWEDVGSHRICKAFCLWPDVMSWTYCPSFFLHLYKFILTALMTTYEMHLNSLLKCPDNNYFPFIKRCWEKGSLCGILKTTDFLTLQRGK